ncbi:MAG TPA: hypothetical protein VJZ71_17195 [Phycisphaerae bacterium]|nr:hypothetical protein [Phycisphaerae bacterium]
MIRGRFRLLRFLAALALLSCTVALLACNNDRSLTERHERTLAEEGEE